MKVKKFFYKIPVEIFCKVGDAGDKVIFFRKEISVAASEKRIAIAIAKKKIIKEIKGEFSLASNIEIKIEVEKIVVVGSKTIDTDTQKKKKTPS